MATRAKFVAGTEVLFDDSNFETVASGAAFGFTEEFVGAGHTAGFPAMGSPTAGYPWVKKLVGTPTGASLVTNAAGGVAQVALAATSEAEEAALTWNDNLSIDLTKRALVEFRAALAVLPSAANTSGFIGVAQAWTSGGALSSPRYAGFGWNANGNLVLYCKDGINTYAVNAALIATPATQIVSDTNQHIFAIDFSNTADVAFSYDGNRVNAVGSVTWGASSSNSLMQVYASVAKSSGTGVATVNIDKVDVYANRI